MTPSSLWMLCYWFGAKLIWCRHIQPPVTSPYRLASYYEFSYPKKYERNLKVMVHRLHEMNRPTTGDTTTTNQFTTQQYVYLWGYTVGKSLISNFMKHDQLEDSTNKYIIKCSGSLCAPSHWAVAASITTIVTGIQSRSCFVNWIEKLRAREFLVNPVCSCYGTKRWFRLIITRALTVSR